MAEEQNFFADGRAYERAMGRLSRVAGEKFLDWLSLPSGLPRLLHALLEEIQGEPHVSVQIQCSPYHTSSALRPFIEQMARVIGFEPEDSDEIRCDRLESWISLASEKPAETAPLFASLFGLDGDDRWPVSAMSPQRQKALTLGTTSFIKLVPFHIIHAPTHLETHVTNGWASALQFNGRASCAPRPRAQESGSNVPIAFLTAIISARWPPRAATHRHRPRWRPTTSRTRRRSRSRTRFSHRARMQCSDE